MQRVTVKEQAAPGPMRARWLGRIAYRDAWALQQALAAARADATLDEDQLLLLEHDPVLTLGRNASEAHVLALPDLLAARGIDVVRVERGGEVTYHGPGQLVAYPIVALASPVAGSGQGAALPIGARTVGVRHFVEALEAAMGDTCAESGIVAGPRAGHPGCWVGGDGPLPRKIGALGIRVARGVSFHGIALNVTTNLADFDLIDPCGMPGLRSTSIERERARASLPPRPADPVGPVVRPDAQPSTASVAAAAGIFAIALSRRLGRELVGRVPPDADPRVERRELEELARRLVTVDAGRAAAVAGAI